MGLLDLLADQKIAAAIEAGELDGLPGAGKPLDLDDDRMVPEDLRMAYRILRNSGYLPPELEQRKEAAHLRRLIDAATDDAERRRAIARLAILETALESRGHALPRDPVYYGRLVGRFTRG